MARRSDERTWQPPLNWGLLVLLGLCMEFWIIVTTAVAENL
jgi:hypothetical protein